MASRPRVLVVAYDFPPHGAIGTMRTLRVVRRLAEDGWDVSVLTSDPRSYRPGTPVEPGLLERVPSGVRVLRAPTRRGFDALKRLAKSTVPGRNRRPGRSSNPVNPSAPRRSLVARAIDAVDATLAIPDHESGWFLPAVAAGFAACRAVRPDVIYSSSPPWTGQLVAVTLARLLRRPWVADFRDPWARAPWSESRWWLTTRAATTLERLFVRRADHVVFVARANRDEFVAAYGPALASKFHVVPNGCDPAEFDDAIASARPDAAPPVERGHDAPFVLLHAGSLYAGRTPMPLFGALATALRRGVIDPARFRVRFLGTVGMPSAGLTAACRDLGLESIVEFVPRVPRDQSVRAMLSASALLLLQPGHAVSVPGKLYEYLAARRPMLAIAEEGETTALVRQSGIGIAVTPDDEDGMVEALAELQARARGAVPEVPRGLYDGFVGAAHTAALLRAVARGESPSAGLASTAPAARIEREVASS